MIKKTIAVFIVLFGVYTLIVFLHPSMSATQHQWQDNVVRAEKYIYNENDATNNLIVGSSLAQRLVTDSLPLFYNLALAGQGIFDGLEIASHRKKLPKNIFIETNIVFKKQNKEFTSGLFSPLGFNIKRYCISLRSDKEPLVFIYPAIQNALHGGTKDKKKEAKSPLPDSKENEFFEKMLKLQISNYTQIPDSALASDQFLLLKNYVTGFKSKGVNIVFFEMPLNPQLVDLPLANFIRNKFYEYFPPNENNYIKMPDCSNYITGDGLHLRNEEALTYTLYFKENAKKYDQ